jgi:penicillin-binding protein 1A
VNASIHEKYNIDHIPIQGLSSFIDQNGRPFSEVNRPFHIEANPKLIPPFVKDILVQSEDQHYYDHIGFDMLAISRALYINLKKDEIKQGGSTITMQLARNLFLNHDRSYNRKLTEVMYAYQLEQKYSKDELLNMYLNTIYFHNGVYGIESASQYYFQKSVSQLTKGELSLLASIPNNPTKYDPINHLSDTKMRQERLIDQLVTAKKLSFEEGQSIKKEPIKLSIRKQIDQYPAYAMYVEEELRQLVSYKEGYHQRLIKTTSDKGRSIIETELNDRTKELISSGIKVYTALNPSIQERATNSLNRELSPTAVEGASVVISNSTREIVALTGGKNYEKYEFNRAYQAFRQPGSTIKPLLVYAPYIEKFKASLNEKVSANHYCIGSYCPENYGNKEHGMVTLQEAFIQSYNTPATRFFMKTGIENSFRYLEPFAFTNLQKRDHVPAAAIGGFTYGMTPLQLTDAFTSFVDGTYQQTHAIRKVVDRNGRLLIKWDTPSKRVWSPATSTKVKQLLSSAIHSGTARYASFPTNQYIGAKTGTTNNYQDYWIVGMTKSYTAGVWMGYDLPKSMESLEQSRHVHHIWRDTLR